MKDRENTNRVSLQCHNIAPLNRLRAWRSSGEIATAAAAEMNYSEQIARPLVAIAVVAGRDLLTATNEEKIERNSS